MLTDLSFLPPVVPVLGRVECSINYTPTYITTYLPPYLYPYLYPYLTIHLFTHGIWHLPMAGTQDIYSPTSILCRGNGPLRRKGTSPGQVRGGWGGRLANRN